MASVISKYIYNIICLSTATAYESKQMDPCRTAYTLGHAHFSCKYSKKNTPLAKFALKLR